jgi:hypothetical protein
MLMKLYEAAIGEKIFEHSERNQLNFFAAAAKAQRQTKKKEPTWSDPVKIFVWTAKNDFRFISEADEKRGERALKSLRRPKVDTSIKELTSSSFQDSMESILAKGRKSL